MRAVLVLLAAAGSVWTSTAMAQQKIDSSASVLTVRVFKAGMLSALGHDHQIVAAVAGGYVDTGAQRVELRVNASTLRVRDSKGSDKDHNEIQTTMTGPDVLDVERYPEIVFRSTGVESAGPSSWRVRGDLALHGQTRPVLVQVSEQSGHYVGHALLKQTDFGIKPVKVAGGTVKVKDEIRIEFDIQLAR